VQQCHLVVSQRNEFDSCAIVLDYCAIYRINEDCMIMWADQTMNDYVRLLWLAMW